MTQQQAQSLADDMLEVGHFLFEQASWSFYEFILKHRDRTGEYARITYDRGRMEIMTGAGVQWRLRDDLAKLLEHFSRVRDDSVSDQRDSAVTPATASEPDIVYVIISERVNDRTALDVTVKRVVIPAGPADDSGFGAATIPGVRYQARLPDREMFPGITVAQTFEFLQYHQKAKK
ncbi:MAG: hypothetical protein JWN40_3749 [Phycisphaerales bacterium]|nr:hypothetical protein [Phycisphaerales bacterium]